MASTDQARLLRDVSSFAGTARKGRAQTCRSPKRLPANWLFFSGAFGFTELVFNVQTANFDAGKPCPAKISASREHWKSNPAFSAQVLCYFPKTLPGLFEQNLPSLSAKHRPTHFKKPPGWQARPNARFRRAGAVDQGLCQTPRR